MQSIKPFVPLILNFDLNKVKRSVHWTPIVSFSLLYFPPVLLRKGFPEKINKKLVSVTIKCKLLHRSNLRNVRNIQCAQGNNIFSLISSAHYQKSTNTVHSRNERLLRVRANSANNLSILVDLLRNRITHTLIQWLNLLAQCIYADVTFRRSAAYINCFPVSWCSEWHVYTRVSISDLYQSVA